MPLTRWEVNLILSCSVNCVICEVDSATIFAVSDTKMYVQVLNLSTKDNTKLRQQLESRFKQIISLQ